MNLRADGYAVKVVCQSNDNFDYTLPSSVVNHKGLRVNGLVDPRRSRLRRVTMAGGGNLSFVHLDRGDGSRRWIAQKELFYL